MAATDGILPPRYADVERIGHGGMGDIFRAHDTQLGRDVAVKVLAERYASDESLRERFKREALAVARLSGHPNIVTIFDVGEHDGRPFIVMELLPGGSLGDRARKEPVPPERALAWLEQAAEAIDSAHAEGIVHRDLKPANLLFDSRDALNVADFGIARVLDESTGGMTQTGMVLGTSGYLSPEQAAGEPATPASDIYSLGVVAYELLTGGRPFERVSTTAEAAAHIHEPVPSASARAVGLPRAIDPVFERALAKEARDRPPNARALVEELRDVLDPEPAAARRAAGPTPPPRRAAFGQGRERRRPGRGRESRLAWLLPLVALFLVAGAVAAAVVASDDDDGTAATTRERPTVVTQPGTTVVTTVVETVNPPPPPPEPPPPPPPSPPPAAVGLTPAEAAAQNDEAFSLMNQGRYDEALPLLQEAVPALSGVEPNEAYAEYNLGKTLLELGRCDEALPHLERSEQLQGEREEITAAKEAAQSC